MLAPLSLSKFLAVCSLVRLASTFALPNPLPQSGNDGDSNPVLIGDLKTKGATAPVGQSIQNILLGTESGQSQVKGTNPATGLGTAGCKNVKDPCCIWYQIAQDLTASFLGPTGRCNAVARMAIRLGFHDAGTWSQRLAAAGQDFGGADGSLVLFNEITRAENRGLEVIVALAKAEKLKYGNAISMADLIQFAANHAVVTCPLGPRVRTFIGRKDATRAAPDGLLPSVTSDATTLINLFADKTISAHQMTALVGAHSTSQQFFVNTLKFGAPQDSTPGVWDVSFYNETLQPSPKPGVFRLQSDPTIAADPRCSSEWRAFVGDQSHWNEDYANAYVRLSLLGVNNINSLTECTAALPAARPSFAGSTEAGVTE
ncbi:peroxidase-4 [Coleophoma cylindrospora]|uniref:Peroxidase n=1 Tax=Coleophoma cylindrospora TaxID=1849047 RepID=A0A3D8SDA1_9HELO|nr:peroxidase-4 [Coleophoma cylindrospora]